MAQLSVTNATKSSTAKILGVSRRTVQRYCELYDSQRLRHRKLPALSDGNGRVNVSLLCEFIKIRKSADGRGFPLKQKRRYSQTRFELLNDPGGTNHWERLPRRRSRTFGRSFEKRLDIIKAEIDAMTDYQQSVLIARSPAVFSDMFRPKAREIAENWKRTRAAVQSDEKLPVITIPRRPRA